MLGKGLASRVLSRIGGCHGQIEASEATLSHLITINTHLLLLKELETQTIIFGELSNGCKNILNTVILLGKRFIFELQGK